MIKGETVMKKLFQLFALTFSFLWVYALLGGIARALPVQTMAPIVGEIERISITTPGNVWSGGMMTVGGQDVILPANLLINLPNDYQSLQQLYANAPPACQLTGETGLAKIDKCNGRATGAQVSILANRTDSGNVIAGQVDIFKAVESVTGTVTYISYTDGYFRVDGIPGDPTTGTMVRINDPTSRHTVQKGLGCALGNTVNCSPDTRFKIDPDNYTAAFLTGYPLCIPITATGLGDPNCPDTNRPPITPILTSNPFPAPPVAADSRRFAPIVVGDSVKADGSFETVSAVTFLSASSVRVLVDLTTRTIDPVTGAPDLTQPDYLIITEADWDGPAYPAGRVRGRVRTNSTVHTADIDYFSIHYDPVSNAPHEQILYTTQFNKRQGVVFFNVPTGTSDSQIRMDFMPKAKVLTNDPCMALVQGFGTGNKIFEGLPVIKDVNHNLINITQFCTSSPATAQDFIDNFNLMVPVFREVMARSTRYHIATGVALDIHGRPTQSGQYKLPTSINYGAFDDINLGMNQFPVSFSGTPWLMDRRLSPNGCAGACETAQQPLTPFPFEGIDPRLVAPDFGFVVLGTPTSLPTPNRMLSFMQPTATPGVFAMTGLLTWPPTNAPAFPIAAVPPFSLFPPFADEDFATTRVGVPVIINVLANDVSMFGTIDPASVKIATPPASGTVQVNPDGTITYTPTPTFTAGTVTFTYTVANNFGSVSLPGNVNVTILVPPAAVNDTATTPAGTSIPINVAANDIAGTKLINLASVNIVSPPTCGTVVNQLNGIVVFTAPAAVPAPSGTCIFSYVVSDTSTPAMISNVATVTVTITPPNVPPVANSDTATAQVNSTITINVIANDTSATSTINPASVAVTAPTGGTAAANANGTVTYTAPSIPGIYTFAYTVQDNLVPPLTSKPAIVTVTVTAPPSPPVANNDTAGTVVGTTITIPVLANDTSATSTINPATVAVTAPTGGTATANPDGTVTYTAPAAPGTYTFTYTVKDNLVPPLTSNPATVTVTVATANVPPVANNDTAGTIISTTITIPVLANDTSATSTINPATVVITAPTGGTATANANGTVTYTAPAVAGTYTFTYTVKDNFVPPATSNAATVTVTVAAANVPPVANNDTAGTVIGRTITIPVLANDTSATSTINPATVAVTQPAAGGGTAAANANGTVTYTAPAVAGTYTFTYTVQDNFVPPATSNAATVTVTVAAANIAPVANNDTAATITGTTITIPVLANDTSATSSINPATVVITTPTGGTATTNPNGTVTYTAPAIPGIYSFAYSVKDNFVPPATSNVALVTVTVKAPNVPPVANNDTAGAVAGSTITINVLANDTSATSTINPATVVVTQPAAGGGTATANANGTVTYTAPAAAGTYTFTYTVQDNFVPPATSNVATVTVTVSAANVPPVANNDTATTSVNGTVTINVIANDISATSTINPATVAVTQPAAGGGTATANPNGTVTYTAPAAAGTYSFTYTVKDFFAPPATSNVATVTVTVTAADIPPVANNDAAAATTSATITIPVLANDTSATSTINPATVAVTAPTGGIAVANANGTVTYTAPAVPGVYTFAYTVQDNFVPPATSNAALVTVTVTAPNVPPVANSDTAATTTGSTITIPVLANDTSATNTLNPATVVVTAPTGGTAVANANGTVTYTAPAAAGTYTFTYTVKDNFVPPATSNVATVTVTVTAPLIPPVANNDTATMVGGAGTSAVINVLANDTAGTNPINPASVVIVTQPINGSATANPITGAVTYAPAPGFVGIDTFTYTVKDSLGTLSNTATVSVTVTPPSTESLTITVAQFNVNGSEWRVEGTTTARTPGETISVFNNPTVGVGLLGTATVDPNGVWKFNLKPGPLPNTLLKISVQSSLTPPQKTEGITLIVR
jgi:hypothetical protein